MLEMQRLTSIALALILAPIANASAAAPNPAWEIYGRPHRLVDIGGRRLNLYCAGQGSPTIILDGGLGDDMTEWRGVQQALARRTRTCSYDRAGLGFSDPGPEPRTAAALATDLGALLRAGRIRPPYLLVGGSLAGLHIRLFADAHLNDIAGMVLVDPSFEHQVATYEAATPAYTSSAAQQLTTIRSCVDRLRAGPPPPASSTYRDCIDNADPDLPADVKQALAARVTADAYRMILSELVEFSGASSDEVDASRHSYGDMPLIVLTAGGIAAPDADAATRIRIWTERHARMAQLSSRGIHRVVPGATHHIQASKPAAVIAAIDEVLAAARARSGAGRNRR
jgi:pimeloyl-ACP methyl ester carboxylesterase